MQRWYPLMEATFWTMALVWLALAPMGDTHFTLCPLGAIGWSWCPGCGLGHAIHALFHGHWHASWQHHPFALPAVIILLHRIVSLLLKTIKTEIHVRQTQHTTS